MKKFKETEIKVERKKELLLSLMTKAVAAQREDLLSSEWDVDYMIEESGTVREFFELLVFQEDDVCGRVLWEFIDIHELDYKFHLLDCSLIDEAREMQHAEAFAGKKCSKLKVKVLALLEIIVTDDKKKMKEIREIVRKNQ
ncbi:hypothetical protein [Vibrio parahaemolyticus]|uniref:hypothetical protein n=1 Tax=Vibrio parahaemolyticus TaxID=670 RepID=UPI001EDF50AD|nr:hypothetical protein [Vibrio parahaemolyticus]